MRSGDDRREALARGHAAEAWVAEQLESEGFEVVGRNVRIGGGELDVVVRRGGVVRFVEVKARSTADPTGLESLTAAKRRRLVRAAEAWLRASVRPVAEVAFLVALVRLDPKGWQVEWVDNAFDA